MSRDVVIVCFATPSPKTLSIIKQGPKGDTYFQPPERFKDPPLVLNVFAPPLPEEKSVSPAFERKAQEYKQRSGKNSIIKGVLNDLAPGVDVRTVTVVTFSGGQAFAKAVIANGEGKYVDGIILLDGLHLSGANNGPLTDGIKSEWQPWVDFAKAAVVNEKLLVLFHTQILLEAGSHALNTTQSAAIISQQVAADTSLPSSPGPCGFQELIDATHAGPPPPLVEIQGLEGTYPNAKWVSKTWTEWPGDIYKVQGSYFEIGIKGTGPQDHIFAATYGQRLVWDRILSPRLNQDASQCIVTGPNPSGPILIKSGDSECVKKLTVLPADLKGEAPPSNPFGNVIFTAAGMGLGYILGRYLWSR